MLTFLLNLHLPINLLKPRILQPPPPIPVIIILEHHLYVPGVQLEVGQPLGIPVILLGPLVQFPALVRREGGPELPNVPGVAMHEAQ